MRKKSGARLLRTGSNITQAPKRNPVFYLRKRKYMLAFHQLPDKTTVASIKSNIRATSKQYFHQTEANTYNVMQNLYLATLQKNFIPWEIIFR